MYSILLVAPRTNLPSAPDEVMQVVNALKPTLLQGNQANIHGLLSHISQPFDIIWFATHGDQTGIHLSDGLLTTSEITSLAKSAQVKLVVLNTCSSKMVAQSIYLELLTPLVCTLREVPDRTAYIFGALFARQLAEGLDFREAFRVAKPGQNQDYIFLPEAEDYMTHYDRSRSGQQVYNLESLAEAARRLEVVVNGSKDYNVTGLVPTVNLLIEKVDLMSKQLNLVQHNQMLVWRLLIGVTLMCIALLVAMSVFIFQNGGLS